MSIDRLHLHSLLCRFQFSLAIDNIPPYRPHFHRRDIIIGSFRNPDTLKKGALSQRGELNVIVWSRKVEYPKPGMVLLVWRWLYDSLEV